MSLLPRAIRSSAGHLKNLIFNRKALFINLGIAAIAGLTIYSLSMFTYQRGEWKIPDKSLREFHLTSVLVLIMLIIFFCEPLDRKSDKKGIIKLFLAALPFIGLWIYAVPLLTWVLPNLKSEIIQPSIRLLQLFLSFMIPLIAVQVVVIMDIEKK